MTLTASKETLLNYVDGEWLRSSASEHVDVHNPATAEVIALAPMSAGAEVDAAVKAAHDAYLEWRHVPVVDRIKPLFKLDWRCWKKIWMS